MTQETREVAKRIVSGMGADELLELLEAVLTEGFERKMLAVLNDAEADPEMKDVVRVLLRRQREEVSRGEHGRPLDEIFREAGLK